MTRLLRHLPGASAAVIVSALLAIFIVVPIGAVLFKSFDNRGPLPPAHLAEITEAALVLIPEPERSQSVARWTAGATLPQRVEATAAAFRLAGLDVPWPVDIPFEHQDAAMAAALRDLPEAERRAVEERYPTALVMLHKRIALAFAVRDQITPAEFDRLRAGKDDRFGFDNYLAVLKDPYLRKAGVNSLMLALIAVVSTVSIAYALAYGLNRGGIAQPNLTRSILLLPLVAPPVLVATATTMLFGRHGLITYTLLDQTLGWSDADSINVYGPAGIILAQTISFLPTTLIVIDNALRRQDGRLEEAALMLGAGRRSLFRHVTLPLSWPGIKRAVVLVFIMSLTDFGNPMILGRDTPVLAGVIYAEITSFQNTPLASAICVWLIGPCLLLYLLLEQIGRRKRYVSADAGTPSEYRPPLFLKIGLTSIAAFFGALILAIYLVIILGSVTRIWGVDWTFTLGHFTRDGVDVGHQGTNYGAGRGLDLVWNSLYVAGIAAPIGGLFAIAVAYVAERMPKPGGDIIAFLALIPAILPGIIFGVGYIVAFNAPFGIKALSLSGTDAILVLNIVFGNLFVGVLAARAALQRIDRSVEEAAESLGAGLLARFFHVTLPMLRMAALLGTLYVFVDGLTTLSSVIFLVSGDNMLASVSIFDNASDSDYGYAAAQSVAILGLSVLAMGLVWWIESRARRSRGAGKSQGSVGFDIAAAGATP